MRLYLAGPMRQHADYNFPAFDAAAARLRTAGYDVFNPADRDRQVYGDLTPANAGVKGFDLRLALAADTDWICREADGIAVLPGWEESFGARAEVALGIALGLPFNFVSHWVNEMKEADAMQRLARTEETA